MSTSPSAEQRHPGSAFADQRGYRTTVRLEQGAWEDVDPGITALLDRKQDRIQRGAAYRPMALAEVERRLRTVVADALPGHSLLHVRRLGGGASKEQFVFDAASTSGASRYVLRMDPAQAVSETDRQREYEALAAYSAVVPAPTPVWLDMTGAAFGQVAAIMTFAAGVTKPSTSSSRVTGLGTTFDQQTREALAPQFLRHLAAIHGTPILIEQMPSHRVPDRDPWQPARWQLNWWDRIWRDDAVEPVPIAIDARQWLRENLPSAEAPATMIHGDYRAGNFLYNERAPEITAILDWEYAHFGDVHEELASMAQRPHSTFEDGIELVCGLIPMDQFIDQYEDVSGRSVNRRTLHWYSVFGAYRCLAITLATSAKAARASDSHQDALLSALVPLGYQYKRDLCDLLDERRTV